MRSVGPWVNYDGVVQPVANATKVNFTTRQTDRLPAGPYRDELESEPHRAADLNWDTPRKLVHAITAYRIVTL